jgi:hypothetical protein
MKIVLYLDVAPWMFSLSYKYNFIAYAAPLSPPPPDGKRYKITLEVDDPFMPTEEITAEIEKEK